MIISKVNILAAAIGGDSGAVVAVASGLRELVADFVEP